MRVIVQFLIFRGFLLIAFFIVGCEKPQLQSDGGEESGSGGSVSASQSGRDFQAVRKSVIGRLFVELTLGSKRFENALVRDITDEVIVIEHQGGVDKVPWSEVPTEVRSKWGYHSDPASPMKKLTRLFSTRDNEPANTKGDSAFSAGISAAEKPNLDRRALAKKVAIQQQMLDAQLLGIRNVESDLGRHSQQLNELRRELYSIREVPSSRRSGGVVVEQTGGKSAVVDRKTEAREVEAKLKIEEELVAQFVKSLEASKTKYRAMKLALDQLQRQ